MLRALALLLITGAIFLGPGSPADAQRRAAPSCERIFADAYVEQQQMDSELRQYAPPCAQMRSPEYYFYMAWYRLSQVDPNSPLDNNGRQQLEMARMFAERARNAGHPAATQMLQTIADVRAGRGTPRPSTVAAPPQASARRRGEASCASVFGEAYRQRRALDSELVHYQTICTRQRSPDVYLYMGWQRLSRVGPAPPLDSGDLSHLRFAQTFAERAQAAGHPQAAELLQDIADVRAGRSAPPVAVANTTPMTPEQSGYCERAYEDAFHRRVPWNDDALSERTMSCRNKETLAWYNMWRARATLLQVTGPHDTTYQVDAVSTYDVQRVGFALNYLREAIGRGLNDTFGLEQEILRVKAQVEAQYAYQDMSVEERREQQYARISGNPRTPAARSAFDAAKTQDVDAMFAYAERLATGDGVTEDQMAANTWLDGAADFGSARAHAALAARVYQGIGNPPSLVLARFHAEKAAEHGDAAGYYWRAMLAWPAGSAEMYTQMLANDGLSGLMFNYMKAVADLNRAEEACSAQPYASDPDYRQVCASVPQAQEFLRRAQGSPGDLTDEDFREQSRRIREDFERGQRQVDDVWNTAVAVGQFP